MKVLVALDGSSDWLNIAGYVGRFAGSVEELDVVLYHVLELRSSGKDDPGHGIPIKTLDGSSESWLAERRSDIEREILNPAREALQAAGSNRNMRVHTAISVETDSTVAENLIDRARRDGCDTIVLGRGKRSRAEGRTLGSVTDRIVHDLDGCAIWVLE